MKYLKKEPFNSKAATEDYRKGYDQIDWEDKKEKKYKTRIVKNAIKCMKCGDIVESNYTHDFKFCSCEAVAVDGGTSYLKRCGDFADYEDLSEILKIETKEDEEDDNGK